MTKPFIKWVGGKRLLAKRIGEAMPSDICEYYEPFVGGAAVFLSERNRFTTGVLADSNEELITCYKAIAEFPGDVLKELILHAKHHENEGYYYAIRARVFDNPVDIAARFIYLNKTCFNGLYRVNSKGEFNTSRGKRKNPQIYDRDNIFDVSDALLGMRVRCGQFDKTVRPKSGDFVYCDPPYDGTYAGYQMEGFDQASQIRLKCCVGEWAARGVRVIVSNSDTPFIRQLYNEFEIDTVYGRESVNPTSTTRGKREELLIRSYDLKTGLTLESFYDDLTA